MRTVWTTHYTTPPQGMSALTSRILLAKRRARIIVSQFPNTTVTYVDCKNNPTVTSQRCETYDNRRTPHFQELQARWHGSPGRGEEDNCVHHCDKIAVRIQVGGHRAR